MPGSDGSLQGEVEAARKWWPLSVGAEAIVASARRRRVGEKPYARFGVAIAHVYDASYVRCLVGVMPGQLSSPIRETDRQRVLDYIAHDRGQYVDLALNILLSIKL